MRYTAVILTAPPGEDYSVSFGDGSDANSRRASEMTDDLLRFAEGYEDRGDMFVSGLLSALASIADNAGFAHDYDYDYGYARNFA